MIHLDQIVFREIRLPLVDPFRTARGVIDARRVILLELENQDGTTAWSECVAENTAGYSHETVDSCWDALTALIAPSVSGKSFASPREIHNHLAEHFPDNPMARASIEMGCWGIQSIQAGMSLAGTLARECDAVPRATVGAGIALGIFPTVDELAARCRASLGEGYRRIKIKIERGRDIELAQAALDAVERKVPITVDANASYTVDDIHTLKTLDSLGLAMIEQPLATNDFLGHAKLHAQLRTPICLDESITDTASASEMISMQSARIVNLKPGRVGGLTESLTIYSLCEHHNVALWCGGMLETGIGRAYNVALASLPNFTLPGDLSPSARYWERDVITKPWVMTGGTLSVPLDRPGIGVDADESFIDNITVKRETISSR